MRLLLVIALVIPAAAIPIDSLRSPGNESLITSERRNLFFKQDDITGAVDKVIEYWVNEDLTSARDERYANLMSMVCEDANGGLVRFDVFFDEFPH